MWNKLEMIKMKKENDIWRMLFNIPHIFFVLAVFLFDREQGIFIFSFRVTENQERTQHSEGASKTNQQQLIKTKAMNLKESKRGICVGPSHDKVNSSLSLSSFF